MISVIDMIEKRKENWNRFNDIKADVKFRDAAAKYIVTEHRMELFEKLQKNPEMLIELIFVVVDKQQKTVPFFLNTVQNKFISILNKQKFMFENGKANHMKFLVLKGRQAGFTTVIDAYNLASAIVNVNFSGFILADNSDNTSTIFTDKIKFPYDLMPKPFRPVELYSNRKELHFQNEDGTGLNSKIRVTTAGNKDAGRSKTINFLHISEAAFVDDLNKLLTGLSEALTRNVIAVLESTANGFNDYKDLWDNDNNWISLFFEWWETPEYQLFFTSDEAKKEFKEAIYLAPDKTEKTVLSKEWIFSRCKWLMEKKGLTVNQVLWYHDKWKDKGESIKQEYPCTAEEAFLASGQPYFDIESVNRRISELKDSDVVLRSGNYEYKYIYDEELEKKLIDETTVKFVESSTGYIDIFIEPEVSIGYSIGADTATTGIDSNIGQILNGVGKQHAVLKIESDEDLFADQLYCLGKLYNNAKMSVEVNHSTHPLKVLVERNYPNLYYRKNNSDAISDKYTQNYGFRTTKANRSVILGELRTMVREHIEYINDITTLKEMMSFIIDETGKATADTGKHDDRILSYAIGLEATNQQQNPNGMSEEVLEGTYFEAELEDMGYSKYDIDRYFRGEDVFMK
jgi:hypothetical protein